MIKNNQKILIGICGILLVVIILVLIWASWINNDTIRDKIFQEKRVENYAPRINNEITYNKISQEKQGEKYQQLPPKIQELKKKIQKKKPDEIYNITMTLFGNPDRMVGSGLCIFQWDVDGGILTMSSTCNNRAFRPPTFVDKTGKGFWLIETENKLGENLIGSYEMFAAYGQGYKEGGTWLGNLELRADGTYKYIDACEWSAVPEWCLRTRPLHERKFFFLDNPHGKYKIKYRQNLTENTLLESLDDNTLVATFEFQSGKNPSISQTFSVYTEGRVLYFEKPGAYYLHKYWNKAWNYED